MFKLYGSAESAHTFKVRLMLEVAALPYEYEEVDLRLEREARPCPTCASASALPRKAIRPACSTGCAPASKPPF